MKKKFLSLFLTVIIACSVFTGLTVSAEEAKVDLTATDVTSGTIGDCNWSYDESTSTLTISGNGAMGDYDRFETAWQDFEEDIKSAVIEDGVTSIGYNAFYGCTNLTDVTIADSVTNIDSNAFFNCTSLASITIPDSVTNIGDFAFYDCESLTSITIPNNVTNTCK
jgi:hypothetical protein